ncbi:MAG: tetratricopeptide repeat protein [Deltaproteobacteria bacterium]|nr:tetratricopeptide repeat protein [Deltaproteobacteria bacterium]
MNIHTLKKRIILSIPAIVLVGLLLSSARAESNRVLNMKLAAGETSVELVILLEERPSFSLMPINADMLELIINNSEITFPIQDKAIERRASDKSDLELIIKPGKPFLKIDSSWLEEENLLFIVIFPEKDGEMDNRNHSLKTTLKNIRFGFTDNATRMVMNISKRPSWKMIFHDPKMITMELDAEYLSTEREKYGPLKGLDELLINMTAHGKTNLDLKFESGLDHVSVFWVDIGNRMVLDLFSAASKPEDNGLLLKPVSLPIAEGACPDINEGRYAEEPMVSTNEEGGSIERDILQESSNKIRMQIPKREKIEISYPENHQPCPEGQDHDIFRMRPRLHEEITGNNHEIRSVSGLRPQEAFLFGRIKQALEINDFDKGVLLAEEFIEKFPESVLIEEILFLRADLYYKMWKSGKRELSGQVIQSYKHAVDRFPGSEQSAWSYIKMAQVDAEEGNNHAAIGLLNMVINKMGRADYVPLAYLTRGKIYLLMDQMEKAVNDFKSILDKFEDSEHVTEALFWIAGYYHTMGLYEEAQQKIMEIEGASAGFHLEYPEYLLLSAKNCLYLKKYDIAREYLFKALNIGDQPESIDLLLARIGDTYHHQKQEVTAEKYYRMVLDYYPGSEGAAIAKLRLANYLSDIRIFESLQAEKNNEPLGDLAILEKGYHLYEKDRHQDVLETLSGLIRKPVKTDTRENARRLYYKSSEMELSRLYEGKNYQELLDLYESIGSMLKDNINPEILLLVGKAYNIRQRYAKAASILFTIKPYDLDDAKRGNLFIEMAVAYISQNERHKARKLLETNRDKTPENSGRHRMTQMLADIYLEEEMLDDAYSLYQSLLKQPGILAEAEIAKVCINTGKILITKKKDKEAKACLLKGISLAEAAGINEDFLQMAHIELGNISHRERDFGSAADSFERAFELGFGPERKEYWETRFILALSYLGAGERMKAEPILIEIAEEADEINQRKAQIRMGALSLKEQMDRLSIGKKSGD